VHQRGIVHRDIKPANLMVRRDGTLLITDFGISRAQDGTQLTASGAILGTPTYLSPEQVLGRPATGLSDVYSLGLAAYECLAGRRPFEGDNPYAVALQRLQAAPQALGADIPGPVVAVVERALATDPADRWPSAAAMADAARAAAFPRPVPPPPPAEPQTWPAARPAEWPSPASPPMAGRREPSHPSAGREPSGWPEPSHPSGGREPSHPSAGPEPSHPSARGGPESPPWTGARSAVQPSWPSPGANPGAGPSSKATTGARHAVEPSSPSRPAPVPEQRNARHRRALLAAVLVVVVVAGGAATWQALRPGGEGEPGAKANPGASAGPATNTATPAGFVACDAMLCPVQPLCWAGLNGNGGRATPPPRDLDCAQSHTWETFAATSLPPDVTPSRETELLERQDIAAACSKDLLTARTRERGATDGWDIAAWPIEMAGSRLVHCLATKVGGDTSGSVFSSP
jgi:hypothetical protein